MPAYGPGGPTNAFLQGATGAANVVHGIARDNRNDAENVRRYEIEQARVNRVEQRALDAETGQRSALRFQEIMRRNGGDWGKAMLDPATTAMVNQDPAFAEVAGFLRENKNVRKDDPLNGFVEFNRDGKTLYTMHAAVDNGRGGYDSKPVSVGRGTTDDVSTFTTDQFRASVMDKLAPYGLKDMAVTIKAHQTLADAERAPTAAAATAPTAAATAPAPMPGVVAGASSSAATTGTAAPTTAVAPPAQQAAPNLSTLRGQRSLMAPSTLKPEEILLRNKQQSIHPTTKNPVFIEAAREEAEAALRGGKAGVYNQDVLRTALQSPKLNDQARAEIEAIVKPNSDTTAELADVARTAASNMTAQFGGAAKHLKPGIVASQKQQDKLAKALPPDIAPEVRQEAVGIVQRAPANRRRTADELGAAIIAGYSPEAITRFAKGGTLEKSDLRTFNPEHDLYDGDRLVRKGVPKADAASRTASLKEHRAMREEGRKSWIDAVNGFEPKGLKGDPRYPPALGRTKVTESFVELQELGVIPPKVTIDDFFALSPGGTALLATAFKDSVDNSKPASFFKGEAKRHIHEAAVKLWPALAEKKPDVREDANGNRYIMVNGEPKRIK